MREELRAGKEDCKEDKAAESKRLPRYLQLLKLIEADELERCVGI